MNIILFGPPGAGKGTQSQYLVNKLNNFQISTGDILRSEIKNDTVIGKQIINDMNEGKFVSDEIVNQLIEKLIHDPKKKDKFIFDGYPRSLSQAKNLDLLLDSSNQKIDFIFFLNVNKETIIKRIEKRKVLEKRSDDNLGTIAVDSIFNPVLNVAWEVIPIPASTEGQERLVLEVDTDGSTSAKDCINHAGSILIQHFSFFMFDDATKIKAIDNEEANQAIEIKATLLKSIDEMELSVRSFNCLQAAGIKYIHELVSKEENQMLKYKNFGRKSLTELVDKLSSMGLHFGMDISKIMAEEG